MQVEILASLSKFFYSEMVLYSSMRFGIFAIVSHHQCVNDVLVMTVTNYVNKYTVLNVFTHKSTVQ